MRRSLKLAIFLSFALGLGSCYEQREGCLDALASNFEIDADVNCCCEYPALTFTLKHLYDTINFDLNRVYYNQRGQGFTPLQIDFYFSDVMVAQGSDWITVDEMIDINQGSMIVPQPDDVTHLSRSGFEFPVGDFLAAGDFHAVRFSVGLNPPEIEAQSTMFEEDSHPLDTTGNSLWNDDLGYLQYHLQMVADTMRRDTLLLRAAASPSIPIELSIDLNKSRGSKLSIPLAIDYREWFADIDFESDDEETMRQKIAMGIGKSISIFK